MNNYPTQSPAAGWHTDPTGRAAQRYWDGAAWTDHVADHRGVQHRESVGTEPVATNQVVTTPVTHTPSTTTHMQSTVVVQAPKSRGVAFLLTFLFGPLGMLYSTVSGAIVMFFVSIVLGVLTLGLSIFVTWPICMIWAVAACASSGTAVNVQSTHVTAY